MRWAGAFSLTGPTAIEMLNGVFMDKAFIGACGVDVLRGVTTIEPDEAAVFRAMVRQAKQVIVVADSSKIGMVSPGADLPRHRNRHPGDRFRDCAGCAGSLQSERDRGGCCMKFDEILCFR